MFVCFFQSIKNSLNRSARKEANKAVQGLQKLFQRMDLQFNIKFFPMETGELYKIPMIKDVVALSDDKM